MPGRDTQRTKYIYLLTAAASSATKHNMEQLRLAIIHKEYGERRHNAIERLKIITVADFTLKFYFTVFAN